MLPFLIRRIDYENTVVSERAFDRAKRILEPGQTSKKEAEIALNILNKISRIERSQNATAYELSVKEKQELIVLTRDVLSKK
jgi:hypothetical protein